MWKKKKNFCRWINRISFFTPYFVLQLKRRRVPMVPASLADELGTSATEFAIVAPMFVLLLLGICSYSGYFWMAHAVQQIANDAARAAIAGLSAGERSSLAQATVVSETPQYACLTPSNTSVNVVSAGQAVTVQVSYDASNTIFLALGKLVPMPSSTIQRSATVMLGGY